MTPREFADELDVLVDQRLLSGHLFDVSLKDMFMKRHPEITNAEWDNLLTVAHNKGLI